MTNMWVLLNYNSHEIIFKIGNSMTYAIISQTYRNFLYKLLLILPLLKY